MWLMGVEWRVKGEAKGQNTRLGGVLACWVCGCRLLKTLKGKGW